MPHESQQEPASVGDQGGTPPPPPGDAVPATRGGPPAPRLQGSLANSLMAQNRHPVLIFGASTSGKSTLLMALFQNLKLNPEIDIQFGAPITGPSDTIGSVLYNDAKTFFEDHANDFLLEGKLLDSTRPEQPFFIPIDVQARQDREPIKFAFLEGYGEWYQPNARGAKSMFQEFRPEIIDVLAHYPDKLSIIFVAPYSLGTDGSFDNEQQRNCDTGLVGVIQRYLHHRVAKLQDSHLFLLTKWDLYIDPMTEDARFSTVEPEDVERILAERYTQSWPAFQAMPIGGDVIRRHFMQYSAAPISGGMVRKPAARHVDTFDRYQKTVWNWLIGNATQISEKANATGRRIRRVLFREVEPEKAERLTVVRSVVDFVLMR